MSDDNQSNTPRQSLLLPRNVGSESRSSDTSNNAIFARTHYSGHAPRTYKVGSSKQHPDKTTSAIVKKATHHSNIKSLQHTRISTTSLGSSHGSKQQCPTQRNIIARHNAPQPHSMTATDGSKQQCSKQRGVTCNACDYYIATTSKPSSSERKAKLITQAASSHQATSSSSEHAPQANTLSRVTQRTRSHGTPSDHAQHSEHALTGYPANTLTSSDVL